MSDGDSTDGDRTSGQARNPRVEALTRELIDASGHFGLRADKIGKATTLLGLSAVRERADGDDLTSQEAALALIKEKVDAWPDDRGRAILRSALGFDHGSERGRPNRLGLLAAELNERQTSGNTLDGAYLDSHFTARLAPDLATVLLEGEGRTGRSRRLWFLVSRER